MLLTIITVVHGGGFDNGGGSGQTGPLGGGGNPQAGLGNGGGNAQVALNPTATVFRGRGGAVGGGGTRGGRGFCTGFCVDCADANVRYCEHCFLCTSKEHKKPDCPLNPKNN